MIEVVYSGKEEEEQGEVRIPKNIRQIGNNQSNKKVYIEDYVMTQLKKKPENEQNIRYGVLLGEVQRGKGNIYIFVKGMVEVKDIIENSIIFNDDIWSVIYNDIKEYFDKLNIVGWFISVPYRVGDDMNGIRKNHLDNFAGNDKVCFLSDRTEKEDGFYVYEQGSLKKQQGYYIYYEKNERMKKYVKNANNTKNNPSQNVKANAKKQSDTSNEKKKNETVIPANTVKETNKSEPKSFRELLKESTNQEPKRQGRMAYGISGLLIVALLLSTVVMLNNYGELKNIKQTLSAFNVNQQAQAVNEILGSYSESAAATEKNNDTDDVAGQNKMQQETEVRTIEGQQTGEQKADGYKTDRQEADGQETDGQETEPETERQTEKSVASAYSGTYHTVAAGQTLYDISMKYYGTSAMVDAIKECNEIDDNYTIIEGQKILLP